MANHQEMYVECEDCFAEHGNTQACADRFGTAGYQKKCQARGDHAGQNEVWCLDKRTGREVTAQRAPEQPASGVPWGTSGGAKLAVAMGIAALAVGSVLARRAWIKRGSK